MNFFPVTDKRGHEIIERWLLPGVLVILVALFSFSSKYRTSTTVVGEFVLNDPVGAEANTRLLLAQIDSQRVLKLPPGNIHLRPPIIIRHSVLIQGASTILHLGPENEFLFTVKTESVSDIVSFQDFQVRGHRKSVTVFDDGQGAIEMRKIKVFDIALYESAFDFRKSPIRSPVVIANCEAISSPRSTRAAVHLRKSEFVFVYGNSFEGYRHGITLWGGESNQRKERFRLDHFGIQKVVIASNRVSNMSAGGIWTSRCKDIYVVRNQVLMCGDVGLDAEGSKNITFSENFVLDCKNGALAVFFSAEAVRFTRNLVVSSARKFVVARLYNSEQRAKNLREVCFDSNVFVGLGSTPSLFDDRNGPSSHLKIRNNFFLNVEVNLIHKGAASPTITGNLFYARNSSRGRAPLNLKDFEGNGLVSRNIFVARDGDFKTPYLTLFHRKNFNVSVSSNFAFGFGSPYIIDDIE